jgi:hypothetical protein
MSERYDLKIVIEHAGPDWVIERSGVTLARADQTIESANFIAPVGATVHSTKTLAQPKD